MIKYWNNLEINLLRKNYKLSWNRLFELFPNRNKVSLTLKLSRLNLKRGFGDRKGSKNSNYIDGRTNNKYYCIDCNKEISRQSAVYGQARCKNCSTKNDWQTSKKFKSRDFSLENHPNWQGGISFEPYPIGWTDTLKESIRQRDNHICQNPECNMTQEENKRALDVHHTDYDKSNLNTGNLISLCHSCHTKTNFNRNYWYAYYKYIIKEQYE